MANFAYEPNRDGLRFLLEEVLPRVWDELPDARAGARRAPAWSSRSPHDPRVEALGFVDDLRAPTRARACAVVPLLRGGGTPLKLVEALAYGLPVVATPRAVAGLDVRDGEHCLLADGADAFAAALVARAARRRRRARPPRARAGARSATRSRRSRLLALAASSVRRSAASRAGAPGAAPAGSGLEQRRAARSCAARAARVKRASTPVKLAVVSITTSPMTAHSDASPKALSSGSVRRRHICQASIMLARSRPT